MCTFIFWKAAVYVALKNNGVNKRYTLQFFILKFGSLMFKHAVVDIPVASGIQLGVVYLRVDLSRWFVGHDYPHYLAWRGGLRVPHLDSKPKKRVDYIITNSRLTIWWSIEAEPIASLPSGVIGSVRARNGVRDGGRIAVYKCIVIVQLDRDSIQSVGHVDNVADRWRCCDKDFSNCSGFHRVGW